jgi:DNA polymerase-3 subunit alpha
VESVLAGEKFKIPELLESFCAQPLDKYRETWRQLVKLDLGNPGNAAEDEYTLVGIVSSLRPIQDKNGKPMAFGSLQDYRGDIDLVFFGKTWENCRDKIAEGKPAALKGRLDKSREKPNFKVSSVLDLERLDRKAGKMAEEQAGNKTENAAGAVPAADGGGATREAGQNIAAPGNQGTGYGQREGGLPEGNNGAVNAAVSVAAGMAEGAGCWRELHIRLDGSPARQDEDLLPLRDQLIENPGPCLVFIHVPEQGDRETVIRTASQISASAAAASINALKRCRGVSEVWGA